MANWTEDTLAETPQVTAFIREKSKYNLQTEEQHWLIHT